MVTIRLYASMREAVGKSLIRLELPKEKLTVLDIFKQASRMYPVLETFRKSLLVAVNHEYAQWNSVVTSGDEVAFFPPVSCGTS